jgi:hypothetical protein
LFHPYQAIMLSTECYDAAVPGHDFQRETSIQFHRSLGIGCRGILNTHCSPVIRGTPPAHRAGPVFAVRNKTRMNTGRQEYPARFCRKVFIRLPFGSVVNQKVDGEVESTKTAE